MTSQNYKNILYFVETFIGRKSVEMRFKRE